MILGIATEKIDYLLPKNLEERDLIFWQQSQIEREWWWV